MNGTQFPYERRSGKCIPDCSLRMGHSFRNAVLAETVSRNSPSEWDAISG